MLRRVDQAIDAHAERAFGFLEALVRSPSVVGSEQKAMAIFAEEAAGLGLAVTRLPFSNLPVTDRRGGVSPPSAILTDGRYQVLAATPGDGPLHLLLNGHMDIVPAETPQLWTDPPFVPRRLKGRLYGRGAADMKSGFAIGMLALRALIETVPKLFERRRLGFLAVVEEECTGNGTLATLVEHQITAPEVVLLEPTNLGLLIGGVGVLWADIRIATHAGHAFAAEDSVSAIDRGMRLMERLRQWATELDKTHPDARLRGKATAYAVNLGKLQAGDWTSSVPSSALFSVRIGYPRGWTAEQAEAALGEIVADFARREDLPIAPTMTFTGFRARGYLLDDGAPLVRDLAAAHRAAHGSDPVVYTLGSTTDARTYINDFGIPAVCFGAVAHDMHGIDESVELASIVDAARTLARFILMRFAPEGVPI